MEEEKRQCTKCGQILNITDFVKNKKCKQGYAYVCKKCKNNYEQKRRNIKRENKNNMVKPKTKICARCNKKFPISNFNTDIGCKDGHRNTCKICDRERVKKKKKKKKENKTMPWWNLRANSVNNRGGLMLEDKINGEQLLFLYNTQKQKCYYCGRDISNNFEIEHKIPISRNGKNVIENISLCCSDCNRLKWTKTEEEFNDFLKEYIKCFTNRANQR